jgi:CRISPR-associated protein Csm1
MDEKLKLLKGYLDTQESELGNSFLYRILNLLRNSKEKVNIARYAYLLVRMEPKKKEHRQSYANFSKKMYEWIRDEADKQQLITAIYIYIYQKRNGSESK